MKNPQSDKTDIDAKHGKALCTNPYATIKMEKRNVITYSDDAKKPAGKKLKFEAHQATTTVFCKIV